MLEVAPHEEHGEFDRGDREATALKGTGETHPEPGVDVGVLMSFRVNTSGPFKLMNFEQCC